MASPGNQHRASCIGTLSFPIIIGSGLVMTTARRACCLCFSWRKLRRRWWRVAEPVVSEARQRRRRRISRSSWRSRAGRSTNQRELQSTRKQTNQASTVVAHVLIDRARVTLYHCTRWPPSFRRKTANCFVRCVIALWVNVDYLIIKYFSGSFSEMHAHENVVGFFVVECLIRPAKTVQPNSTQQRITDTSKSASSLYAIINKQYHFMTSSDRFPVPVRSAVKSNFTNWCCQNLSKRALNALTVQASTTELGKLFQIFYNACRKNAHIPNQAFNFSQLPCYSCRPLIFVKSA